MKITYLGTASVLLEYGGLRIITDPVLDEPGQKYSFGPWYAPKKWFASTRSYATPLTVDQLGALDVALVSHDHHADNLDTAGRALLAHIPFVVTNPAAARRLKATGLAAGQSTSVDGVTITAVPARHGPRFTPQVNQVTGFLLSAGDEPTVWISGDTVLTPALRAVLPTLGADVAIVHCGGVTFPAAPLFGRVRFTMHGSHAAEAAALSGAAVIIPVHRSGWGHFEPESHPRAALTGPAVRWLELGESTDLTTGEPGAHCGGQPPFGFGGRCHGAPPRGRRGWMLSLFKENTMTSAPLTTGQRYLALWGALPRELGFHALTMPIATTGFVVAVTLVSAGVGTIVTFFIGVFIFIAALYASRGFGTLELLRLEWAGRPPIERPVWSQPAPGFWGWLRSMFGNGHYWLYLLHTMVINFIISLITWTFMVTWVATALGGTLYSFIAFTLPNANGGDRRVASWILEELGFDPAPTGYPIADVVLYTLTGLGFLATLPLVSRGLILMHEAIARGTLGAFTSDALRRQVGDLTVSRGAAIAAEGHSLRRLERDIHDGPQQRLVRLQMDLAAAERQLDTDPRKAKKLIAEAMDQSKEALEELRALSRGFAPPILLDRGLVAALQSAADRSPVPVKVIDELGGVSLPQEIERNAYFVVSEALANVAKHAGATESTVSVWVDDERALTVAVYDNGRGGAVATPGHGLAGLEERLLGLGGTLTVDSPDGGPTTILAHLPLAAST